MKYILITVLLLSSYSAAAQWRKVADFIGTDGRTFTGAEPVTCVYFLDLPGPPRIGFVGTQSELDKTTDGGQSWHAVWDSGRTYALYSISDICFKDTLTGWFSITGYLNEECYRTTDGGETWTKLTVPGIDQFGGQSVFYSNATGRLFLSCDTVIRISSDLGNTWPDSLPYGAFSFSFWTPLRGIADGGSDGTKYILQVTSDGGITWDTVQPQGFSSLNAIRYILAIPGTSTCLAAELAQNKNIWRSDDFGQTWRGIAKLPLNQYCTGYIRGDFSRLYVQTDSAMYVSIDSGVTWINDGELGYQTNFTNDRFYAAKGATFAGRTHIGGTISSDGLWEETWPQSGVAPASSEAGSAATASPNPAGASTLLSFTTPSAGSVRVEVFDVLSHKVTAGFSGTLAAGSHSVPIALAGLAPGVYYARIQSAAVRQMVRFVKE
jgi:photosystem II stability/assembly factor-like uncharacterized protein